MKKKPSKPARTCADCIHEWAFQAWDMGNIHNMDASSCQMYETVKDSAAYLCGKLDGKKEALHGVAYRCPVCDGTGVVYGPEFRWMGEAGASGGVVLCKDCRYWQDNNGGYPHPECRWGRDETPDGDDYCSFGERLEVLKDEP